MQTDEVSEPRLLEMLSQKLVHLKRRDTILTKNTEQLIVYDDLASVVRVLQLVSLYLLPHLADYLTTRHRTLADDRRQVCGRLQRLLQRIGFVAGFGFPPLHSSVAPLREQRPCSGFRLRSFGHAVI